MVVCFECCVSAKIVAPRPGSTGAANRRLSLYLSSYHTVHFLYIAIATKPSANEM